VTGPNSPLATDFDIAPQELNNLADVLVPQLEVALAELRRSPQDIDLDSFARGYLGVVVVIRELAKMRAGKGAGRDSEPLQYTQEEADQALAEMQQRYGRQG
jgi:hypothetical protein